MSNIFGIGLSGLSAFQSRLATTGHNIANINTEGYSRQTVSLGTLASQPSTIGYVGSGVQVDGIRRNYDDFLAGRVRTSLSSSEESGYLLSRANQVDNVIADPMAGMSEMLSSFFNAVNDVADDPTSIPTRDVMLSQAEDLVGRFQSLDGYLSELRSQANTDLASFASEVNQLTAGIADLNNRIQAGGQGVGDQPNDLMDMRDHLIDELSQYVSVTTVTQSDGRINLFVGNGQALVTGGKVNTLEVQNSQLAADQASLYLRYEDGSRHEINELISGGKLGGVLRFQQEVLDPAQDALGGVALGLAGFFNEQHEAGMDLDGELGNAFFALTTPQLLGHAANAGTATATFDDLSQVQPEEYDLRYDGATWQLIRRSDDQLVTMTGSGTAGDPFIAEGVSIVIGGGAAAGDRYLLRPTRGGAADIGLLITDPRDIAAAGPVLASAQSSNAGTGDISFGALTDRTGSSLAGLPVTLVYDSLAQQFNVSNGDTILYDPATDSGSSATVTIAGLGDFSFELTGTPANGDVFTLGSNTGGVGDNRNARSLADLQTRNVLLGGRASITDAYAIAVADVGNATNRARSSQEVQAQLLNQAQTARDAVSGVNLDEEAANLMQFQQAYQASAQVISAANNLIETLLGIVR